MKRLPKKTLIPVPGYLALPKLLEINRDAIRAYDKNEKYKACKALLQEILIWSSYSNYEAIGILQVITFDFIMKDDEHK